MIMARAFGNRICLTAISGPAPAKVDLLQADKICAAHRFGDGVQRAGLCRRVENLPVRAYEIISKTGRPDGGLNVPCQQFQGHGLPLAVRTGQGKASRIVRLGT